MRAVCTHRVLKTTELHIPSGINPQKRRSLQSLSVVKISFASDVPSLESVIHICTQQQVPGFYHLLRKRGNHRSSRCNDYGDLRSDTSLTRQNILGLVLQFLKSTSLCNSCWLAAHRCFSDGATSGTHCNVRSTC